MPSPTRSRLRTAGAISAATAAALLLGACSSPDAEPAAQAEALTVADPIATTYDGGILVLDGSTLQVVRDIPLDGFNRLNPAGDDRHALVSTPTGFQVLDLGSATLTDVEYPAPEPGHVVAHDGRTVLFADGTGEVLTVDTAAIAEGPSAAESHRSEHAHHGVAVELADGSLVTTLGTEQERTGIHVLGPDRTTEIARSEDCPGVHGEAAAPDETVVVGCENGVLIYRDGTITKVTSPTPYGRIGNQRGSEVSPITLGDYKQDENAELERPTQISLIDTTTASLRLVDIGTSYTFRSLGRGPAGEALVLGTDGQLHVIDPVAGSVTSTIPVLDAWEEPLDWQEARPALFVRGGTAYVTDPATAELHEIDLAAGTVERSVTLPAAPNEITGIPA